MKKIILLAALLLSACGSEEEITKESVRNEVQTNVEPQVSNEDLTQGELNEKLKEESTRADIVEINVENPPIGKKVYIDGEVDVLTEGDIDEFLITSKESKGYGVYKVKLINTTDEDFKEGDQVRVYGAITGKDEIDTPEILATVLDKK
ncbi:hypothetical protein [Niallia taxi]|uniref:hypothetical protein n=1 Tax=Niallia taxi TaxID=2499688 RepID=UPI0015F5866F|nr:hypothetical protein [Niallia taxi]